MSATSTLHGWLGLGLGSGSGLGLGLGLALTLANPKPKPKPKPEPEPNLHGGSARSSKPRRCSSHTVPGVAPVAVAAT